MSLGSYFGDIPGTIPIEKYVPSHAAATATEVVAEPFRAPFKGTIVGFGFIPLAAVTGDDTNRTNINILNKGTDGSTGAAEITNLDLATGVNLVAFDEKVIPLAANYEVIEGQVIVLQHEKVASGVLVPAGTWIIYMNGNHS